MVIEKSEDTGNTGKKGQAMVEFAIVVPIVMVLVLAIFDFGRLIFAYSSVSAASREAARYGSGVGSSGSEPLYNNCDGIKAAAIRIGRFAGVSPATISIYHDEGPGTTSTQYCTNPSDTVTFAQGDRVSVKVDAKFTPIVPLVNIPAFWLHSQNAHTILMGAKVDAAFNTITTGGQTCDITAYSFVQTNPLGPTNVITIRNNSGTDRKITEMIAVWVPKNNEASLTSITDPNGVTTNFNVMGILDWKPITWNFPTYIDDATTPDLVFTLTFSKALSVDNEPIISLYLDTDKTCAFGNW